MQQEVKFRLFPAFVLFLIACTLTYFLLAPSTFILFTSFRVVNAHRIQLRLIYTPYAFFQYVFRQILSFRVLLC